LHASGKEQATISLLKSAYALYDGIWSFSGCMQIAMGNNAELIWLVFFSLDYPTGIGLANGVLNGWEVNIHEFVLMLALNVNTPVHDKIHAHVSLP
ncbi:MAG: hypothetical protein AAFW74_09370, partial [Pseudomonadota bacterium]